MSKKIYLDYNATTPAYPEVVEAMMPFFSETFGNASSVHAFGRDARYAVEVAREKIAQFIGAESEEIIFTSCGTESNNLALRGVADAHKEKGNHIITASIEHSSILRVCQDLEKTGSDITYLPVDKNAFVDPQKIKEAITHKTILITIMHANNEVGTIEPVADIGKIAGENNILFHTDATQSIGKIPVNVRNLNGNLPGISGHKIGGPKGIGFLYKKIGTEIYPQIQGGSHERNMRAGTENVPGIVGLGKAIEILGKEMTQKNKKIQKLRDFFEGELKSKIDGVHIMASHSDRLPNTSGICFENADGSSIMRNLDLEGIAVSTGSACMSGAAQTSHVLAAMGVGENLSKGAIRFSFGAENTEEDVVKTISVLQKVVDRTRKTVS